MGNLKKITFAGNSSDIPESYTRDQVDRLIAVEAGDRVAADIELQAADAALQARIDNIIAHGGSEVVTTLWTGDAGQVNDILTLSSGKSNFDYIDIYTTDQYFRRIPVTAGTCTLERSMTSSLNGNTPYLEVFNTELIIDNSDTTIKVYRTYYWNWSGSGTPSVVPNSDSLYLPITKIDGVKYELPAELIDIRTGADGTVYPTAGDAVRGQVTELKSDLTLLVDEVPDTVQTYTFTGGSVSQVTHTRDNVAIRTDVFVYGDNTITETRTLNTGESLTIVTNLTTLETTVTYSAAA